MSKAREIADINSGIGVDGDITSDGLTVDGVIQTVGGGSVGAVAIGVGDTDSGLYRSAFNEVRISAGGKGVAGFFNSGDISFYEDTGTTPKFFWDASAESLGIGTSSPVSSAGYSTLTINGSTGGQLAFTEGGVSNKFIYSDATNLHYRNNNTGSQVFYTSGPERMRIDSSGNVLVGTTSDLTDANILAGTTGIALRANKQLAVSRTGNTVAQFNRNTSDGDIVAFRKDGSTVGSIRSGGNAIQIGTANTGIYFADNIDSVAPYDISGGSVRDNAVDLGYSGGRFNDVYAANGTIQTSDRNEKQDIDVLSEAETRVAQACKGLLRKFRWQDAVAEKGDDARIHFGIIAQDLQDAFTAEGLDAGRYAMFISSTWWEATETYTDDDGVEQTRTNTYETQAEAPAGAAERTRLGVRYPELLAFIIAAI